MLRKLRNWSLAIAGLILIIFLFRHQILAGLGWRLVKAGDPHKADIALVLAGDQYGNRILKGAELVREGYAPKVLVSGPGGLYGKYECDLAIAFAVAHGYPETYFIPVRHWALSTKTEAQVMVPALRRLDARTVLLVTSDFHTRRAGKIFRAAAPDLTWYVVAAPDHEFAPSVWWHTREGRKVFFIEWMKTFAEWFGV